jgi:hypothetical protein
MPSILSVTISSIVSGFCPDPVLFPFESGLAVFAEGPFSLKNNCSIPHLYETVQGILSGFDFNIFCFDDEQIDFELQKRRGKGGVITIWPQKFSHKIEKLEKEERFVVIEVLADKHKMILINNYLPTMTTGLRCNQFGSWTFHCDDETLGNECCL